MQFTPAERCFNLFFKKIAILYKPFPYCKNNEHLHMLPQNTNGVCTRIPTRKKNYLEQNNCFPFLAFDAQVSLCCTAKDNLNLQQSLQKQPACTFTYIALNSSTERRRTLGVLIVERVSRSSALYTCCTQNDELQIFCKPRDPRNNSTKSSLLRWMRSMFQRLPLT